MKNEENKSEFERQHLENINLVISLYKANMSIPEIVKIAKMPESIVLGIIQNYQKRQYDQKLINKYDSSNYQGRIK